MSVLLPNFLVIGALKAGTTSLYEYLRAHPQVFMPGEKELRFFVEQRNWRLGREWYESHFARAEAAVAIGEASPAYTIATSFPGVPERIAGMIPHVRLIYILRNPIERMKSHYLQRIIDGTESRRPERAFLEDLDYLHTSRYAFQLERYLEFFPREQILILLSEDLRDRRVETMRRAFDFLGVDPSHVPETIESEHNISAAHREPVGVAAQIRRYPGYGVAARIAPPFLRRWFGRATRRPLTVSGVELTLELDRRISEALRADIEQLRSHVGNDFDGWGIA